MENSYELKESDPNLLSEFEVHLVRAGSGKRFANLLIDVVFFYVLIFLFAALLPGLVGPLFLTAGAASELLILIFLGLYLSLFELVTKGKTLGKIITGTKAVQEDGSPITASMAFSRGFSRIVPFEAFSALGSPPYPWHDKWSHTLVIDEAQSRR